MLALLTRTNECLVDALRQVSMCRLHGDKAGFVVWYAAAKRASEHYVAYSAALSLGRWSALTVNPGDILGPILSPHQANDTWQGQVALLMQGKPIGQKTLGIEEAGGVFGIPWTPVDVRDVAEAEIRLAESADVESGSRFLAKAGDKVLPEQLGQSIMELFPGAHTGAQSLLFACVNARSRSICAFVSLLQSTSVRRTSRLPKAQS